MCVRGCHLYSHLVGPLSCRREQFVQWVESLSGTQTPSWLGLPNNAEKVLLTNKGELLSNVAHVGCMWMVADGCV